MENFLLILYICIAFLFGAVFIYWIYGIDYAYVFPAYCIGVIIACTFLPIVLALLLHVLSSL